MFTVNCGGGFKSIYVHQTHHIVYIKYINNILCYLYLNNIIRNKPVFSNDFFNFTVHPKFE